MTPDPQQTVLVFEPVYTSNTESSDYLAAFTIEPSAAMHRAILEAAALTARIPGAVSINLMCLPGIEAWDAGDPEGPHPATNAEGAVLQALTEALQTPGQSYSVAHGNIFVRVYPDGDFALRFFEHHTDDMTDSEILRFDSNNGQLGVALGNPPPEAAPAEKRATLISDALGERVIVLRGSETQLERELEPILEFAANWLSASGRETYDVQGYRRANRRPTVLLPSEYEHIGGWAANAEDLEELNNEKLDSEP